MRPIPIPAAAVWSGARRIVMAGPSGDLTEDLVRPVEAIVDQSPTLGVPVYTVMCLPEGDDLEVLRAGGTVLVAFYGGMVPFEVAVLERVDGQVAR